MKRFGIVGLGGLVLLFVGALILSTAVHWLRITPEQRAQRKDEQRNGKVQRFCEDYVQNSLLKAPSAAHFGGEAFVRMPGTNVHSGSFWVDSQNSFGVMVRTHFRCSVTDYVGRFHDLRIEQVKW